MCGCNDVCVTVTVVCVSRGGVQECRDAGVQAEGTGGVQVNTKIYIYSNYRQEDGVTPGNIQHKNNIDRPRQTEWDGTKYTEHNGVETGETDDQNEEQVADKGVSSGEETKGSWEV